jgi:hypothetical protein
MDLKVLSTCYRAVTARLVLFSVTKASDTILTIKFYEAFWVEFKLRDKNLTKIKVNLKLFEK